MKSSLPQKWIDQSRDDVCRKMSLPFLGEMHGVDKMRNLIQKENQRILKYD